MLKVTLLGAGSTVFAKNTIGDIFLTESTRECEVALYDIDAKRLEESYLMVTLLNKNINGNRAKVKKYLGVENRKKALKGASIIINAIQVGGYEPSTVIDFEIPKKFGLRQTIADTLGIGGIFRALRTIPVLEDFAKDIEKVCPDAWFLNYVNPMGMNTGYMQRYTGVKTIGLCHSVQVCTKSLMQSLGLPFEPPYSEKIAGINHMAWLLELKDKNGNDMYPEIRRIINEKFQGDWNETFIDRNIVRLDYVRRLGYYVTESSEHNAEYNPFYIKDKYPELIEKYRIPLDLYPKRCIRQINEWEQAKEEYLNGNISHTRSSEYASYIFNSLVTNEPYQIGGNVINNGLITNLPSEACVEVPCLINQNGIHPCYIGKLPVQLAAMNMTNVNVQLLTIEAAVTKKKEHIYQAAMLDPHTAAELSIDDIVKMCDELIEAHGDFLPKYN